MVEGALAAARVARAGIDMRTQKGEHPRVGAMDVCPFVPVSGVTMDDCVALANDFGRRAAAELGIPVYLYGHAAKADHRRTLQQIRAGEYEAIADRIGRPEWAPDYGPAEFVPQWGATCAGARDFLIAYNVNVLGTKEQAHRIALERPRAGPGARGAGPAEGGAGDRVVGRGVRPGAGLDQPRGLPDDAAARRRSRPARRRRGPSTSPWRGRSSWASSRSRRC